MEFKHYLKFISLGNENLYQIAEPIGFDGATFVLEQEPKRYGRDYQFGAISKLEFVDAYSFEVVEPFIVNPQGDTSNRLEYGLQWLLYINKKFGFEAKVEYILEKDGLFFSNGMLDFTEKGLTDGYTYFSCKLIQNDIVADVKRRIDDKFNAFSNKDAKENTITPMPTFKYLKRATPITGVSKFKGNGTPETAISRLTASISGQIHFGANNSNLIEESGIRNTLSFLSPTFPTQFTALDNNGIPRRIPNDSGSFQYLQALDDLSDVEINLTQIVARAIANYTNFGSTNVLTSNGYAKLVLLVGGIDLEVESFDYYELHSFNYNALSAFNGIAQDFPSEISLNIPFIGRGKRVYIYFVNDVNATFNNNDNIASSFVITQVTGMNIEFKAISTSIDQVIRASRWIDLIKQASKFTSNLPVDASLFDANGTHYQNVVFTSDMVVQKITDFTATTKDVLGSIEEVNCDYEISNEKIFIGHQNDFYKNQEIAVLQILPDVEATQEYNDRNMINKFRYGYKTFEQERTSLETSQSFHTDTEWRFLNEQVENFKEIKNDFVRDPFATQQMINLKITQPNTSTSQDDKIYIENYTDLPPNSFGTFGSRLLMRVVDNKLEILNIDSNGETSGTDVVINWTTIGVEVGSSFQITEGENVGNYVVFALTNSLITLIPIGFVPTFEGDGFIVVKYFYTGILYQTRTNQGFSLIQGLNNANKMPNLAYSIKRNMKYFSHYFATCLMYAKKDIVNAYFKNNGLLTTQLTTETDPLTEEAPILYSSLPTPIVNATIHNLNLYATFEDVYNYLEAYKDIKGVIRCFDYSGKVIFLYAKKLEHNWMTNELEITGEEKYKTEFLNINGTIGNLFVNDIAYDLSGIEDWWKFENDFIQLFDEKSRPLSTKYAFNFVVLNGVTYNTKTELTNALLLLNE